MRDWTPFYVFAGATHPLIVLPSSSSPLGFRGNFNLGGIGCSRSHLRGDQPLYSWDPRSTSSLLSFAKIRTIAFGRCFCWLTARRPLIFIIYVSPHRILASITSYCPNQRELYVAKNTPVDHPALFILLHDRPLDGTNNESCTFHLLCFVFLVAGALAGACNNKCCSVLIK